MNLSSIFNSSRQHFSQAAFCERQLPWRRLLALLAIGVQNDKPPADRRRRAMAMMAALALALRYYHIFVI